MSRQLSKVDKEHGRLDLSKNYNINNGFKRLLNSHLEPDYKLNIQRECDEVKREKRKEIVEYLRHEEYGAWKLWAFDVYNHKLTNRISITI